MLKSTPLATAWQDQAESPAKLPAPRSESSLRVLRKEGYQVRSNYFDATVVFVVRAVYST